jgi:SAM-dependent methyltransferase
LTAKNIPLEDFSTGAEFYAGLYANGLAFQAEWLLAGSVLKSQAVQRLLTDAQMKVTRLCELGCGTGAVLRRCRERGIGSEWFAMDYSSVSIAHVARTQPEVRTAVGDITAGCPFPGTRFDLLLLSHVLEHLENPAHLLQSLAQWSYSYVLVEVPLENLPLLRLKCRLFGRNNSAGHVQFFDAASFRKLFAGANLEIVQEVRYAPVLPVSVFRLMHDSGRIGYFTYLTKLLTGNLLPRLFGRFWRTWYYAHYAVLCKPK